jgi:hypothetical protein
MRKASRKITSALNVAKTTAELQDPNASELDRLGLDAFYQRMFVGAAAQNENRDIYLHVLEISVAMLGVCLTGVSILNNAN